MKNRYRFTRAPTKLTRPGIRLENFSLVPASLLAEMADVQAFADRQPTRTVVMVLPSPNSPLRGVYRAISEALTARGKSITFFPSGSARHPA